MTLSRTSLLAAACATLLLAGWQAVTVHVNYGGHWSALFCIGGEQRTPAALASGVWTFANSPGYDGQWYRIVAHDPWLRTDLWRAIDDPALRYRRVLLPAVAWVLALGKREWIDAAYPVAVLGFVFLGAFLAGRWMAGQGQPEWPAIGFALMPGTLICADRMVVDVALYACIAAALLFWQRRQWGGCWAAAALAWLARDLGSLLIGALALASLREGAWKRAAAFAGCAAPAMLWFWHVDRLLPATPQMLPMVPDWVLRWPLIGPIRFILRPPDYPFNGFPELATQTLDRLLIAGVSLAVILAVKYFRWQQTPLEDVVVALYVPVFFLVSTPRFWHDPYSAGRAFTPMVSLLAWRGVTERSFLLSIPACCVLLRTVWQLGPQALGVAKAFFQ